MPVFANEVLDIKMKDGKKMGAPPWMELKLKDPNSGRESKKFVFDAHIQEMFKQGCGLYDLEMRKSDKGFWNIVNAKLVRTSLNSTNNGDGAAQAMPKATGDGSMSNQPYKSFVRELDPNTVLQNRSICAQVAVKAVTELMIGLHSDIKSPEGIALVLKDTLNEVLLIMDRFIKDKKPEEINPTTNNVS